jgi:hypothetical protein
LQFGPVWFDQSNGIAVKAGKTRSESDERAERTSGSESRSFT